MSCCLAPRGAVVRFPLTLGQAMAWSWTPERPRAARCWEPLGQGWGAGRGEALTWCLFPVPPFLSTLLCLVPLHLCPGCFPAVLKARVKQLQASPGPEVTVSKAELAPQGMGRQQEPAAPRQSPAQPSGWVEKLKREMYVRQAKVERKLSIAASKMTLVGQANAKVKVKAVPKAKAKVKVKAVPKAKAKPKAKKSPKETKAAAWSQGHASPRPAGLACSKPGVVEVKQVVKAQKHPNVPEKRESNHQKIMQQTIQSNLECLLCLQQPEEAERLLLLYHSSPMKRKLLTIGAYNIVMRSWARKVWGRGVLPGLGSAPWCWAFREAEGRAVLAQGEELHARRSSSCTWLSVRHAAFSDFNLGELGSARGGAGLRPPMAARWL